MKLTASQFKALPLLVTGMTQKEVAEKTGVTPQTVSGWMKDPEFVAYLNKKRFEALEQARDVLRNLALEAVTELRTLMTTSENDEVRRKVIMDVLEMIGLKNPNSGVYGWGIGPKTPKEVTQQWKEEANPQLYNLLGSFCN